ncbi:hypothetical protein DXG03_006436, partial [Asterophora parasitica]
DIPRATRTYQASFAADPVIRYIRNERPQTSLENFTERILISAHLVHSIRAKIALTIDAGGKRGIANIVASPPKGHSAPPHDAITRLAERVANAVSEARRRANRDPEVVRRRFEVEQKLEYAVIHSLGKRRDKMWYVEELWTSPEERGNGYGGKLIDGVAFFADIAGVSTWLQCSNLSNVPFYNAHGFETIETVLLGDDNPIWGAGGKKPIVVSIMVREPRWPPKVGVWVEMEDFVFPSN